MSTPDFREASRAQVSMLAPIEKKVLVWLAERTPAWINPDHLTVLGLVSLVGAGASYWYAHQNKLGLLICIACLVINWVGDSLDGTLARVRDKQRPRYGFYVDHTVDALGTTCLLVGLALSGYMIPTLALALLIIYLLLSIEVYLATYTIGEFHLSFWKFSPTELRILLSVANLAAWFDPGVRAGGNSYRAYDIGGAIGVVLMAVMLIVSVARHTAHLYRSERIK